MSNCRNIAINLLWTVSSYNETLAQTYTKITLSDTRVDVIEFMNTSNFQEYENYLESRSNYAHLFRKEIHNNKMKLYCFFACLNCCKNLTVFADYMSCEK